MRAVLRACLFVHPTSRKTWNIGDHFFIEIVIEKSQKRKIFYSEIVEYSGVVFFIYCIFCIFVFLNLKAVLFLMIVAGTTVIMNGSCQEWCWNHHGDFSEEMWCPPLMRLGLRQPGPSVNSGVLLHVQTCLLAALTLLLLRIEQNKWLLSNPHL